MSKARKIGHVPTVTMGPFDDPLMIAILMAGMARSQATDDEEPALPDKCPYNMDQETHERVNVEYRRLLGDFTIKWGLLEMMLDNISGLILGCFDHSPLATKRGPAEMPRSLDRKLDFHRRAFRKIAALKPFEAEALLCVSAVADVRNERNTLTHGILLGVTNTGAAEIWKLERRADRNVMVLAESSPDRIRELMDHADKVIAKLANLSDRLLHEGRAAARDETLHEKLES